MDFLNNAFAQTRELFLSMTPGARVTAGLLLAVVLVSVGFLFRQRNAGPDEFLFGGEYLSQSEMNEIESAIAARGLSEYQREGNRIRVPAGQKHAYLAAVADADALPRSFHNLMQKSLDSGSLLESRESARQRVQIAKAQTLSEIVRKMAWVNDAVVLFDEQTSSGFNRVRQATASVNVEPIAGESLSPHRVKALQKLVSGAVLELKPEEVVVTGLGDDYSLAGSNLSPELFEDDYLKARATFNSYQRERILGQLSYIPGIRVEVNATLDNIAEQTERTIKPDEQTAIIREIRSKESMERSMVDPSGRPGLDAQGPYRDGADLASQQNSDSTKSETSDNRAFAGYSDQHTRKAGFMPTAVHASVAVPNSYVREVWRKRNDPAGQPDSEPEPSDLQPLQDNIKSTVENLVNELLPGHLQGEDKFKYVTVQFVDTIDAPEIVPSSLAETALAWTGQNWGTLTMACLAIFSLLMLRSMVSSPPQETSRSSDSAVGTADDAGPVDDQDEEEEKPPRLRLKKPESLKDDLVEMVREDPDAAATILRSWISNAA